MSDLRKTIAKFVWTKGEWQWSELLQRYVLLNREGYWYEGLWALAHNVAPTWEAEDFQFFNDDGDITGATSIAAENVAVVKTDGIAPGTIVQLKVNVGETAGAAGSGEHSAGWTLQFNINGGGFTTVGAATTVAFADSSNLVNNTVIVVADYALNWGSSGTQRDFGDECEDGVSLSGNIWSNDFCEICFVIQLDAVEDDVVRFQMLAPDGTTAVTFNSVPTLTMDAAGNSDIAATPAMAFTPIVADLKAQGKLDATPDLAFTPIVADLTAKGKLDAAATLAFSQVATLAAKGKLDATPALAFIPITADLKALGKLDAAASLAFTPIVATLGGRGKLDAAAALAFTQVANLTDASAVGPIDAAAALAFSQVATLTARGKLDAAPALAFTPITADLKANGKLDAAAAMVFSQVAALTADGKLDAAAALAFSLVANLIDATPGGDIAANPQLAISATADLKAGGKLDATAMLAFAGMATLTGKGQLASVASIAFTPTANLGGIGKLDALAQLRFLPAATLIDAALVIVPFIHIDIAGAGRPITITAKAGRIN